LELPSLQEASRRPFWNFHRCKNVPDNRFGASIAARRTKTTDFVLSAKNKFIL